MHTFRETKLVVQVIQESRIKNKTMMTWSLRKKDLRKIAIVKNMKMRNTGRKKIKTLTGVRNNKTASTSL